MSLLLLFGSTAVEFGTAHTPHGVTVVRLTGDGQTAAGLPADGQTLAAVTSTGSLVALISDGSGKAATS